MGVITAAATSGALVAIGHRMGSAGFPFAAIGAAAGGRTAAGGSPALVAGGVAIHVLLVLVWSALFVWLVRDRRWPAGGAAIAVVVGAHALAWIIAFATGHGLASVLQLGDRIVYAVVFAGALVVGIRFAFFTPRRV